MHTYDWCRCKYCIYTAYLYIICWTSERHTPTHTYIYTHALLPLALSNCSETTGWKFWAHRRTAVRQDFLWWSPAVPWVHFRKAPFPLVRSSSWIQKPWQCLALTKRQVCMNIMESVWEMRTAHFPCDLRFDFVSDIEPQADMIPAKHAHQC